MLTTLKETQCQRRRDGVSCTNSEPDSNGSTEQEYSRCNRAAERVLKLIHILDKRNKNQTERNSGHASDTQKLVRDRKSVV